MSLSRPTTRRRSLPESLNRRLRDLQQRRRQARG